MSVYYLVLAAILINGIFFGKKRKWYVFSTFFLIILVAALRSTDIGIDLAGHYARDYVVIAKSNWNSFSQLLTLTGYDPGFVVLCKILGYISVDPQCFIVITSIFIYFSVATYIYKYSDDVVLETFLFFTSFMYFMYMTMIAQAIAIAVIMWDLKFLLEKKYIKYCILALLAVSIHSSAILVLLFIPLASLKVKKNYIIVYILGMIGVISIFNKVFALFVNVIFPQFSFYLSGNIHGKGQVLNIYTFCHLLIYILSIVLAGMFIYYRKNVQDEPARIFSRKRKEVIEVAQFSSNFLVYMTIAAIIFRLLATRVYVVSRMGYYTYFFGLSLLTRSVNYSNNSNSKQRFLVKLFIYIIFMLFFVKFGYSAGKLSYGVVPYEIFK